MLLQKVKCKFSFLAAMSFQRNNSNSNKIASLWGNSWQKLTLKQQQLVSQTLNSLKITNLSEQLEEKAGRIPVPEFEEASKRANRFFLFDELESKNLTLNWQLVLAKLSEALIKKNSIQIIELLFLELDYAEIHRNAIQDTCAILRGSFSAIPFYASNLIEIERKVELIKELITKFIGDPPNNRDRIIDELGNIINELNILEVYGLGAFMLAATLQLLLMQEKAIDAADLAKLKSQAVKYINYAKSVNPKLFRLSLGQIDKTCKCIKYSSHERGNQSEYECRYCDGRNIQIFQDFSDRVGYECNKHRLKMFHSVAERVNQTVSQPVRSTIKKWQEFAVSLPPTSL